MNSLLTVNPEQTRPLMERVHAGASLRDDSPLIFREGFGGRVIAVGQGQDVRSACAILKREFVTPQGPVQVGLIGSVSTDPGWQGKGLATRVLIEAEAALERLGCHLALLWANEPRFYYARGYRPLGCELDFVLPATSAPQLPAPQGVRPLADSDSDAVHRLYLQHPSRVAREPAETHALLACPGMTTLVLERDGQVVAYACLGRGYDLKDAIHEWAGGTDDVLALVRAHLEARRAQGADGLVFMAPGTAEALAERLIAAGADASAGILGLGKVLDLGANARLLERSLGTRVEVSPDVSRSLRIQGPNGPCDLSEDTMLSLLFPAYGLTDEVEDFRRGFGLPTGGFPIDLFAWGLDSI